MAHIISRSMKIRPLVGMLLLATGVSSCGQAPVSEPVDATEPTPVAAPSEFLIVVLGDSLSAGLGLAEDEAFPAVAQALLRDAGRSV